VIPYQEHNIHYCSGPICIDLYIDPYKEVCKY